MADSKAVDPQRAELTELVPTGLVHGILMNTAPTDEVQMTFKVVKSIPGDLEEKKTFASLRINM